MKAKEFIPASKPRNFVAKNQQTAGAGAHRDKKKEQKQGYEKHKGRGVSEGLTTEKQILTRIRQIMHDRKLSGTESNAGELLRLKQQLKDLRREQGVSEGDEDPSEEEMDRTVSDLHKDVFGIRPSPEWGREWMSMSEQEKRDLYYQMVDMLDQQQDMSEGYGNKEFEVDGYTYMTDLDREEDNQKIWHMIKTPDGETVNVDFTPYAYMTKDDVELYVKLGMPKRQGVGPLDSEQLQKMAQIKGVAMLDPKMARAGL